MPTLDAPEERLRKFKYRGKDASVSMKECLILSGMSSVVWWLRLHTSTVGIASLIPGWGTEIPHTAHKKRKGTWLKCIKNRVKGGRR